MSGKKYTEEHQVVYYETNVTGRLNIGNLVDLCMLVSTIQSEKLGVSTEKLDEMGYGWIVTQNLIDVTRLPKEHEKIKITTVAKSYNRYFCYRDFYMHDENNQEIVHMHTVFALMDKKQRKIARIKDEIIGPYEGEYTTKLERLANPRAVENVDYDKRYRVRFMDIDSNQHVNNIHYFDWMLDTLPEEFLKTHEVQHFNIVYKNEVRYGEVVDSKTEFLQDENVSLHQITVGDKLSCVAEVKWQPLK